VEGVALVQSGVDDLVVGGEQVLEGGARDRVLRRTPPVTAGIFQAFLVQFLYQFASWGDTQRLLKSNSQTLLRIQLLPHGSPMQETTLSRFWILLSHESLLGLQEGEV